MLPCVYGISGCATSATNRVGGDACIHGGCEDTFSGCFHLLGQWGCFNRVSKDALVCDGGTSTGRDIEWEYTLSCGIMSVTISGIREGALIHRVSGASELVTKLGYCIQFIETMIPCVNGTILTKQALLSNKLILPGSNFFQVENLIFSLSTTSSLYDNCAYNINSVQETFHNKSLSDSLAWKDVLFDGDRVSSRICNVC